FGVSEAAAELADRHVSIPMLGMVESYNVSVAAAIVLLEAQRQRMNAGMYDQRRLSNVQYHNTLFRWYRPVEARYCDEQGLDYPELNDEGDLCDPEGFAAIRAKCSENEMK
ncbi:MAG: TrmH family RNA methyltransferase, partial [Pseudomonadota bacterium]